MDPQNVERRDSKKSNKNGTGGPTKGQTRGGGGSTNTNPSSGGGGVKSGSGEKQRSHSQKSGKPYREIYKPPSLRSSKNRSSSNGSNEQPISKGSSDDAPGNTQSKKSNPLSQKNTGGNEAGGEGPPKNGTYNNETFDSILMPNNGYSLFGNGNNGNTGNSSVPSSPLISNRVPAFNNTAAAYGLAKRMLNVNAKEFQFLPPGAALQQQQQQQQQISNFLSQFDPAIFYNNSPILASSGCYPLKQSKSSGNMNVLLQQQQQAAAIQQLQTAMGFGFPIQSGNFPGGPSTASGGNQFNRLSQSKSSGNVPGTNSKPRVRFDDEEPDMDEDDYGQLGNYLASLRLNGDIPGMPPVGNFSPAYAFQQQQQASQQQAKVPLSPQPVLKSSLQKSRTGFYLNLYGNQQQPPPQMSASSMLPNSPTKPVFAMNPMASQQHASNYGGKLNGSGVPTMNAVTNHSSSSSASVVKRSRSFGPGNHHMPRASAASLLSAMAPSHSVFSDFCISKWPKVVQELVTAAVTGVERIPARNWIEMVNGIFEAMLCDFRAPRVKKDSCRSTCQSSGIPSEADDKSQALASSSKSDFLRGANTDANGGPDCNGDMEDEDDDLDDDDDDTDLPSAAVHIFLYFIQREKDRTVMESLLNTCFASFQRLSSCSVSVYVNASAGKSKSQQQQNVKQIGKHPISRQWCNFLRFLSTLYSQVKLIRRQKQTQQPPGYSMDEISFSLLALLCDSCLATLRSPQSYTAEMMSCLFTVLTSIGRDMEGTFPLKMKQLLAAVRDALLGIGPYHQQQQHHYNVSNNSNKASSLSPVVQKTLMQLIELHAANWQLPASAVRYYYTSVNKSSSSSTNTTNNNSMTSGISHQSPSPSHASPLIPSPSPPSIANKAEENNKDEGETENIVVSVIESTANISTGSKVTPTPTQPTPNTSSNTKDQVL